MNRGRNRGRRSRVDLGFNIIVTIGLFAVFLLAPRPPNQDALSTSSLKSNGPKKATGNNVRVPTKKNQIPKIIHLIYVSRGLDDSQEIPADVVERMAIWKKLHSDDWHVQLWDNAAIRLSFPDLIPTISKIDTMAWVADLLRYHILQRFGGIYIDTDEVGIRSLDLLLRYSAFTVCQSPMQNRSEHKGIVMNMRDNECLLAANGIIGSVPNHPALVGAIEQSMQNTLQALARYGPNPPFHTDISGPPLWNKFAYQTKVTYLRSFTFLPFVPWEGSEEGKVSDYQDDDRIFGMHLWDKSWRNQPGSKNG